MFPIKIETDYFHFRVVLDSPNKAFIYSSNAILFWIETEEKNCVLVANEIGKVLKPRQVGGTILDAPTRFLSNYYIEQSSWVKKITLSELATKLVQYSELIPLATALLSEFNQSSIVSINSLRWENL